jgi:hypothetical protein
MRLTAEELKMHNDKVLRIAELRCEKSNIPGITVSFPDFMKGDKSKVQLALPCGIIRDQKRKVNAMQVRTGAFVTSLAKEVTKYDDELGPEYQDNTDYMPFIPDNTGEAVGDLISVEEVQTYTKDVKKPTRMKGILDL